MKNKSKKFKIGCGISLIVVVIIIIAIILILKSIIPYSPFQKDADIIRLQHLRYYGELLDKYYKKTGKYPFQGLKDIPIYIHIATKNQEKQITGKIPYAHEIYSFKKFIEEIEKTLSIKLERNYDPQKHGVYKPNYYIYGV